MKTPTPFFPAFRHLLFGTPPRSARAKVQAQSEALRRASLCQLAKMFETQLPPAHLAPTGGERRRCFPAAVTFWAFLSQTLDPDSSCRETLHKVQSWCANQNLPIPDTNTGAYCRARKRLDGRRLRKLHRHGADQLQRRVCNQQKWVNRQVKVIDGTGISMPDTRDNQRVFPQPSNQKPGCGFPVAKIVGCFCLSSGALIEWVEGSLRDSERTLFRKLWPRFQRGDVVLADRGFCSYESIATLLGRGVDSVMRLHHARPTMFCQGRPLGHNQRLVRWEKPARRPKHACPDQWALLPEFLEIRYVKITVRHPGFRTRDIIIVTTLTDPNTYPAEALGELYFRRWSVELFFRDIKMTLGMDVLRCKTPDMIRKEITMHAIAYNLIRGLMQEAAASYEVDLTRISFKGTTDALRQWTGTLNANANKPRKAATLKAILLESIANDLNPLRPGRVEPRAKKRRPKNYNLLNKPRREMVVPAHRGRAW